MPNPKRLKSNAALQSAPGKRAIGPRAGPTVQLIDSKFAKVAQENWLEKKSSKVVVKDDVLKTELWDPLVKDGFSFKSLADLESLQTLEGYLWPGFAEDSSDWHVLLIVALLNVKRRERLETWGKFPLPGFPPDFAIMALG